MVVEALSLGGGGQTLVGALERVGDGVFYEPVVEHTYLYIYYVCTPSVYSLRFMGSLSAANERGNRSPLTPNECLD